MSAEQNYLSAPIRERFKFVPANPIGAARFFCASRRGFNQIQMKKNKPKELPMAAMQGTGLLARPMEQEGEM